MTRSIDELSNLTTKRAVEPKKYFEEMDLTEEQVKKRVEYTEKAYDIYDLILIMILTMADTESINFKLARGMLERQLQSLINEYATADDYLIDYASDMAFNFIDTTAKHISEEWYTSTDRALFNAENSANDVLNYVEYKEAIESGKTHKKWITERDNRVRETHKEVSNKVIPIKDFFRVGLARMRFPKDYEYAGVFPEELIGCRCTIEYSPKNDDIIHKKEIENYTNNGIMNLLNVYTGGKRNEIPLSEEQQKEAISLMREQGYPGDIEYSIFSKTGFGGMTEGDVPFHHMVIGTDIYPSNPSSEIANERISARGCAAHEVVGHYEAWIKGTTQKTRALEEAQASFRASKFGIKLSEAERDTLWQDGLDRLKHDGFSYDEVKDLLDIWER